MQVGLESGGETAWMPGRPPARPWGASGATGAAEEVVRAPGQDFRTFRDPQVLAHRLHPTDATLHTHTFFFLYVSQIPSNLPWTVRRTA